MHLASFLVIGLIAGTIIFLSELNSTIIDLAYIDAIFTSYSALCITGLLTIDFSKLNLFSQIVGYCCLVMGGITISPLMGLLIKIIQSYQRMNFARKWAVTHNYFASSREQRRGIFIRIKQLMGLSKIPVTDYEFLSLVTLLLVVCNLLVWLVVPIILILGIYLQVRYHRDGLSGNNPWWVSLFVSCSAFNNAGITLFSDNLVRFKSDAFFLLLIVLLIASGNTLFPAILRTNISILYQVFKKRPNGPLFQYILQHHHRLSIHLFPLLQTQIYLFVTFLLQSLGTLVGLLSEYNDSSELIGQSFGVQFLASFFHSVSTRSAGFNTVDLSTFGVSTLLLYIVMMRIKPQMFCALNEEAYGVKTVIDRIRTLEGTDDSPNNKSAQVEEDELSPVTPSEHSSPRETATSAIDALSSHRVRKSDFLRRSQHLSKASSQPTKVNRRHSFSNMPRSSSRNKLVLTDESSNTPPPTLFVTIPTGTGKQSDPIPESARPLLISKRQQLEVGELPITSTFIHETQTNQNSKARNNTLPRLSDEHIRRSTDSLTLDTTSASSSHRVSEEFPRTLGQIRKGKSMDFILESKKKQAPPSSIARSQTMTFGSISRPVRDTFNRMARRGLFGTPLHYLYTAPGEHVPVKRKFVLIFKAFITRLKYHLHSIFVANNLWLLVFMFLICAAEQPKLRKSPLDFSFFKILFELISAYGNVGLSLGYSGSVASFSVAFTVFSKLLIILTMIIGRHRGMKKSTKEQNFESKLPRTVADFRPMRDIAIVRRSHADEAVVDKIGPSENIPFRRKRNSDNNVRGGFDRSSRTFIIGADTLQHDEVTL